VRERLAALDGVRAVETRVVAPVLADLPRVAEAVGLQLVSLRDDRQGLCRPVLRGGRWPDPRRDDEVLLGEAFADAHRLQPGDRLPVLIGGRRVELRVTGTALSPEFVYALGPGRMFPDDLRFGPAWMPRRALSAALDMRGAFNDVLLTLDPGASVDEALARVDRVLAPFGCLGALARRDQQSHWFLENEFKQLRSFGVSFPLLFLAVAAFLLNVALGRIVSEEREQIGLLKAFGYGDLRIGLHYLGIVVAVVALAVFLGTLGGGWLGRAMTALYQGYFRFPELPWRMPAVLPLSAAAVSLLFAGAGAARAIAAAVRLPPAQAMQPPSPPRYRRGFSERLPGWQRLPVAARIVLRGMGRRPLRTVLSVLGIGFGIGLLVCGNALMDSFDEVLDRQYRLSRREDLRIDLRAPRALGGLDVLRAMPGVRAVEAYRGVPVELRHGPRVRRSALQGMPSEPRLERLLDVDGVPIDMPADGLVLGAKLAELLEAGPGDTVDVEVLDGRRQRLRLPVVRVVDSWFGSAGYLRLDALARRLDETPSWTSAGLLVDPAHLDTLHARLKEQPEIAAVTVRAELVRSVRNTSAESIGIMSFFFGLFALVVAVGVVYNNARLTLAEQGRDFASMRVLGFRVGEVSAVFLGELWLVTALAIVPGLGLGRLFSWAMLTDSETELYTLPLHVAPATYTWAALLVVVAAILAGLAVRLRLHSLDMVSALKTRE
jgi:putative ABC transport system permease protein